MPGFDDIIGQQLPIRLLQNFLRNQTLPHALLFTGISGIGKSTTAIALAMALNCLESKDPSDAINGCGRCRTCRQIIADSHPDIIRIAPQGNYLRIGQIRELLRILSMKSFTDGHRVAILAECHAMNQEAANALLKALEEPPADTTLILTAHHQSDLLPTIVSRCRHIRFNRLNEDDIVACLPAAPIGDGPSTETAAAMAGGSLTRAGQLLDARWQQQHDWLIQAAGLDRPGMLAKRPASVGLAFAAQLAAKKEKIPDLLEILKLWIRDLAIWPYQPGLAVHRECENQLSRVRESMDDSRLLAIWSAVEKAQKAIAAKANLRLTLDIMALSMIRAAEGGSRSTAQ